MLIGILGDTHDHLDHIRRAVRLFNDRGCGLVIHGGDIVSPIALPAFRGLKCRIVAVFGDNDGNREGLVAGFRILGDLGPPPLCVRTADERRILVAHRAEDVRDARRETRDASREVGVGESALRSALAPRRSAPYDAVITSHTHRARIERSGGTLRINAGEACGWVFGAPTVALYDTERHDAQIVRLDA